MEKNDDGDIYYVFMNYVDVAMTHLYIILINFVFESTRCYSNLKFN